MCEVALSGEKLMSNVHSSQTFAQSVRDIHQICPKFWSLYLALLSRCTKPNFTGLQIKIQVT